MILFQDTLASWRTDVKYPISTTYTLNRYFDTNGSFQTYSPLINTALSKYALVVNASFLTGNEVLEFNKINVLDNFTNDIELDVATSTVYIYNGSKTYEARGSLVKSKVLSFALQQNLVYKIKMYRNDFAMGLEISDGVNSDFIETSYQVTGETSTGIMIGIPQVRVKGSFYIRNNYIDSDYSYTPKIACIGDSITAGTALIGVGDATYANAWHKAWVYLLQEEQPNILIAGWGGETPEQTQIRFRFDVEKFRPEYVHLMVGTNAVSYDNWLVAYDDIIARIKSNGGTPILGTLPPRASKQALINQINADIIARTSEIVVNYSALLSIDGLGQAWKSEYELDGIHPNVAGNLAMKNLLVADVPDLIV